MQKVKQVNKTITLLKYMNNENTPPCVDEEQPLGEKQNKIKTKQKNPHKSKNSSCKYTVHISDLLKLKLVPAPVPVITTVAHSAEK